ncbi:acid phosphatase [Pseudohyphozyma bogoriensis]|nr:acid phosphatase [Pseudohyphozyma bogoriensis]
MVGFGDIPAIYPLCSIGRQFSTAVLSFTSPASPSSPPSPTGSRSFEGATDDSRSFQIPSDVNGEKLVSSAADGSAETVVGRMEVLRLSEDQGTGNIPVRGGPSDCYWGELTDLGRQSTLTLGARLRALYVDQLGFLPSSLPDLPPASSPVAFRSTGMPRTIESLHQIVQGLFPERDGPVQYVVRNAMDESLYPNSMCARMRRLDEESAKRAALTWNPSLAPLDSLIGKYINGPVRIDGHPRANGILDTVMVCLAHKIRVPKEFDDEKLLETLENAVVHEWFDGYQSPEFAKLAMGRLLGDLKAALERKVADPFEVKDKLRLAVNSCHDTSLGGILNALNVFDSRWRRLLPASMLVLP